MKFGLHDLFLLGANMAALFYLNDQLTGYFIGGFVGLVFGYFELKK
jgi:hypothetical protein